MLPSYIATNNVDQQSSSNTNHVLSHVTPCSWSMLVPMSKPIPRAKPRIDYPGGKSVVEKWIPCQCSLRVLTVYSLLFASIQLDLVKPL